ncbi:MAG: hypothetical protein HUN04_15900 [Desulfobacter sp.]|nr:MAG: hypothetical protein HUN04_15900 [Desulfobacter sp.]
MSDLEVIQDYVRANYDFSEYESTEDPVDVIKITRYDQQAVDMVPEEAGFHKVLRVGDWFIKDLECGYLVRVVEGEVMELWASA